MISRGGGTRKMRKAIGKARTRRVGVLKIISVHPMTKMTSEIM